MKKVKIILFAAALTLVGASDLSAQSKAYTLGKWVEIQSALLRELNRHYVDSLPVDRIERAGVNAMLESLDPYTVYVPKEENEDLMMLINKSYGGIGAVIYKPEIDGNVIINEPYADSPASRNGLKCGDEIMEIDGKTVAGLTSTECSEKMRGTPGTEVVFTVKKVRTGEVVKIKIIRDKIHLPDIEYAGMLDDTTGYVLQSGFTEGVSDCVREEFLRLREQGMKRFVLDLRGNGGGLLQEAVKIVGLFVPKGSLVVSSKGQDPSSVREYKTSNDPVDTSMPIMVLVDNASASASEIVSGALQDFDRAVIMGKRTYGKGLVQSMCPMPYDGVLKITTAKYYTPSGRCVQAIDYSHRNEDGSVGFIPDSLTHEFKTASGRIVRDGGGITPDVDVPVKQYSRLAYSLVLNGIVENYALEYVRGHESIPPVDDFHFTAEDYEDFIKYAMGRTFDYRSSAKTLYDQMVSELRKDGLEDSMKPELEALAKAIDMDKEHFLRLKMDEMIPFIEEEIAVRYYFQAPGVKIRLRYDDQLWQALRSW